MLCRPKKRLREEETRNWGGSQNGEGEGEASIKAGPLNAYYWGAKGQCVGTTRRLSWGSLKTGAGHQRPRLTQKGPHPRPKKWGRTPGTERVRHVGQADSNPEKKKKGEDKETGFVGGEVKHYGCSQVRTIPSSSFEKGRGGRAWTQGG